MALQPELPGHRGREPLLATAVISHYRQSRTSAGVTMIPFCSTVPAVLARQLQRPRNVSASLL